jgi:Glycosyltransferase family 17
VIYDLVMLRDELDVLAMRCEHLERAQVRHVVVEASVTHRGEPKPFHFARNLARFARWRERIIYRPVTFLPDSPDPWMREHVQRDAAWPLPCAHEPEDLVLIADVDEIPDTEALAQAERMLAVGPAPQPWPAVTLEMTLCIFAVDWLRAAPQRTSVITTAGYLSGNSLLPSAVRDQRDHYEVIPDGGWHFTWLGGPEAIAEKLAAHCHTEKDGPIASGLAAGELYEKGIHFDGKEQLIPATVDSRWPACIAERRCPDVWFRPRSLPSRFIRS